ncbi:MAG: DUF3108 domain-containing protein [Alphaproteobacteria bacterium]|nr:DUF3108 domain-containing protein [Alphaproteobacteria bacterium]
MRRDVPAARLFLRCAFGLAVASCTAVACAETVRLRYELSVSGIGAADMAVAATLTADGYAVRAQGETYGAASMFDDLKIDAQVTGTLAGGEVRPSTFGTDNMLDGRPRHARVGWLPTGEATTLDIAPTLADEERTPIPDPARLHALDPISALFAFALGAPARGICEGSADVFDGRRSYSLALAPDPEGVTWVKMTIGDAEVVTLRCAIQSRRTGGVSPSSWFSSSGETETARIWFWRDPRGRAIPVRVEADAPIGYGVGQLAGLPDYGE